jgi:hypothetical protein
MKGLQILVVLCLIGGAIYFLKFSKPSLTSNISQTGNEIIIEAGDVRGTFTRLESFHDTFMLFGGGFINDKNAISPITLSTLQIDQARDIWRQYPDFNKCKSAGAPLAKQMIQGMSFIPTDSNVLAVMKRGLDDSFANVKKGADRVCMTIEGSYLQLEDVQIPEHNLNLTEKFTNMNFFLGAGAEIVECKTLLEEEG